MGLWQTGCSALPAGFSRPNRGLPKRESRRFVGDYMLTQNDCMAGADFPDTISHAGWPIDLHNPKGIYYVDCKNLYGPDNEGTVDGIHFTDIGFYFYAKRIEQVLADELNIHPIPVK